VIPGQVEVTFLRVPFSDKESAKALGARWDFERKSWYAPTPEIREACVRWPGLAVPPEVHIPHVDPAEVQRQETAMNAGAKPIVGERYFDLNCNCVPWDLCVTCQRVMAVMGDAWMGGVQPAQLELSGVTQ